MDIPLIDTRTGVRSEFLGLGSILDYGYFGILAAEFGPDGRATGEYSPKPSYRALANCSAG